MRVVTHPTRPSFKPTTMELQSSPMIVWLDKTLHLEIDQGDTLDEVAGVVREHWGLGRRESRALVAYWFAIGERVYRQRTQGSPDKDWSPSELSADPDRRYLR